MPLKSLEIALIMLRALLRQNLHVVIESDQYRDTHPVPQNSTGWSRDRPSAFQGFSNEWWFGPHCFTLGRFSVDFAVRSPLLTSAPTPKAEFKMSPVPLGFAPCVHNVEIMPCSSNVGERPP